MQAASNAAQAAMGPAPGSVVTNEYKPDPAGRKMKALTWQGSNNVKVMECDVPAITQDKDVILKVTGTTICGSDLHLYHGEIVALQKNDILGHEFMGVVDEVGPGVTKLKKGDVRSGFFGYSHFTGGFPGGQAEYVRVPFGDVNCLPIPDDVSDEQALYLSDVLPTSYHCVVDTGVKEGDVVGVWGLGPIGQCVVRWALLKGAKRVIAIDQVPARLEMAGKLENVETIDFSKVKDVPGKILEMIPGGLDCALDCGTFHEPKSLLHKAQKALMLETDVPETPNECIRSVRKMGRVGLIAAYASICNQFNIGALMEKGVRFIGNGQAPVHLYWEEILNDYIRTGKFDPRFMISHRVKLDEFAELYDAFDKRQAGVSKVFVETKFSNPPSEGCPKTSSVHDWTKEVL
ncbi:hypothetical protein QFC19_002970 [Naganishia cerealis]|uniref:Uncharacterized protein n=1 Tax=Naganishia cerealis TaxID=610337 RepID=A0ACC2W6W4_9TREE|nr:hypothetical protein QFC19_002970 [Naganishia cerealis]